MRRLFWLVAAVVLVDTMFFAAVAPLLPHYSDELDLSKTGAGVLTAAYPAGTFVGALPAGWLAIRWGVKPTLLTGLAMLGVTSLVFGFANHIVLLDAARFVQGIGGACMWAAGMAWLVCAAPTDRRGELIGAALSAAIVGVLLGPVLGGAATVLSPEVVFSSVALVAAVLAGWAWSMPGVEPEESPGVRALLRAMRRPAVMAGFWLFTLPALFAGVIEVLVPLRFDDLGVAGATIGAVFLVSAAVEAVISPLAGRVSDRVGRLGPIRVGLVAAAGVAILLPLPSSAWLLAGNGRARVQRARDVLGARDGVALGRGRGRRARPGARLLDLEPGLGGRSRSGRGRGRRCRGGHVGRRALQRARSGLRGHLRGSHDAQAPGGRAGGLGV